jgi:hypothetical protein
MSTRIAAWLAWSLSVLSLMLTALGTFFLVVSLSRPDVPVLFLQWIENALLAVAFSPAIAVVVIVVFSTVGALIASRRPDHPIGWFFCAIGLVGGVRFLSYGYAAYSFMGRPGSLPAGEILTWVASWLWVPDIGLFVFLSLLFPNGRLPDARWRPVAWGAAAVVAVGSVGVAFSPGPIIGLGPIENPLGFEIMPNVTALVEVLLYAFGIVASASVLMRLRRARGVERQQIKWYAYAAALLAGSAALPYVVSETLEIWWLQWVAFLPAVVGVAGLPVAVGIAILKYRLYDIDLLINRTLVYGPLTAMLVAVYFGAVVLLQRLFVALTGEKSTLAVVASTLAIAALFNPLRRRVQAFVDRRFYRKKYDAAKTLETFSAKLRDETDLEALNKELVGVVRDTMQPAHVSLWLRPGPASRRSEGPEQIT